jgi:hypothetical protein
MHDVRGISIMLCVIYPTIAAGCSSSTTERNDSAMLSKNTAIMLIYETFNLFDERFHKYVLHNREKELATRR